MRKSTRYLAILLFLLPSLSFSQAAGGGGGGASGKHAAGLQIGQVWPAGALADDTAVTGTIAPGIFYEFEASEVFSLLSNITLSSHNDKLSLFGITVGIRTNLFYFDKLTPFAFGGLGLHFVGRSDVGNANEEIGTTNFGLNLGFGADLELSESFFMGILFSFDNLFSSRDTLANGTNVDVSGRITALRIRGGIRF